MTFHFLADASSACKNKINLKIKLPSWSVDPVTSLATWPGPAIAFPLFPWTAPCFFWTSPCFDPLFSFLCPLFLFFQHSPIYDRLLWRRIVAFFAWKKKHYGLIAFVICYFYQTLSVLPRHAVSLLDSSPSLPGTASFSHGLTFAAWTNTFSTPHLAKLWLKKNVLKLCLSRVYKVRFL